MIDLSKKTEIVLKKRGITPIPSQVALAVDISGSMQDEYAAGIVQAVVERCLAVAMKFDTDQQLDVWVFDHRHSYIGCVTAQGIDGFVAREITGNKALPKFGSTAYGGVLKAIAAHYYGNEGKTGAKPGWLAKLWGGAAKANSAAVQAVGDTPVMVLLITDGENSDRAAFEKALLDLRARRAYVQFVGIGNSDLSYLEAVARAEPNAGFVQLRELRGIDDEALLSALISTEFAQWMGLQRR